MGLLIRDLRAADLPAVHAILLACGPVFTDEEVRVALEMAGAPEDYELFSGEVDGKVRGFACAGRTPLTRATWHLYWIAVHPGEQGTGLGRAIQAHVEDVVKARGGERIVLETSGRSDYARARRFYGDAGYQQVGRIEGYYRAGDDCIVFCKVLT